MFNTDLFNNFGSTANYKNILTINSRRGIINTFNLAGLIVNL